MHAGDKEIEAALELRVEVTTGEVRGELVEPGKRATSTSRTSSATCEISISANPCA